jgi:hypothetical protein
VERRKLEVGSRKCRTSTLTQGIAAMFPLRRVRERERKRERICEIYFQKKFVFSFPSCYFVSCILLKGIFQHELIIDRGDKRNLHIDIPF